MGVKLKIETAKKILEIQAEFLGWSVPELMMDIKGMKNQDSLKNPLMMYSKKVVEAYEILSWDCFLRLVDLLILQSPILLILTCLFHSKCSLFA